MIRENDMRIEREEKPFFKLDSICVEAFHLLEERLWIDDRSAADVALGVGVENSRWNQMEPVFAAALDDRVAGIISALRAGDMASFFGQKVDDLSLPLIAPLHAYDSNPFHSPALKWFL